MEPPGPARVEARTPRRPKRERGELPAGGWRGASGVSLGYSVESRAARACEEATQGRGEPRPRGAEDHRQGPEGRE